MKVDFGKMDQIGEIQEVFRVNAKMVGFVMKAQIEERIRQKECLVVMDDSGTVQGAVNYHKTRRGYTTIYEIASNMKGGGTALINKMKTWKNDIKLKTTEDNAIGINFYKKRGFKQIDLEKGKKRRLVVFYWESPKKKLF